MLVLGTEVEPTFLWGGRVFPDSIFLTHIKQQINLYYSTAIQDKYKRTQKLDTSY